MLFRSISAIFIYFFFSCSIYAEECLDVFPTISQNYGPQLDLPNFNYSSEVDGNEEGANLALAGGEYKDVKASDNGLVFFTELNAEYRFKKLELKKGSTGLFVSGDYWVKELKLKNDSTLAVIGAGTVRIYAESITIEKNVHINDANGKLILISYDNISSKNDLNFTGVMYALNSITLNPHATVLGAVTGGTVSLGNTLSESYQESSITEADFNGMCGPTEPPTLIVDYRFDECSYTSPEFEIFDQTGNYNAQINGVNKSSDEAQINKSLDLSATSTNDWVTVPKDVIDGLDDFTVSVWINTEEDEDQQEILHALGNNKNDDELEIYLRDDDEVYVKIQDKRDSDNILKSNIELTNGRWHHLLITRVDDEVCLYVNGDYQDCDSGFGNGQLSVPTSNSVILGQEQDDYGDDFEADQSFLGLMDEFKIYDQALSTAEINTVYLNELAKNNYDGSSRDAIDCNIQPVAEYRFDESSYSGITGEVIDSIGDFNGEAFDVQPNAGLLCNAADLSSTGTSDFITLDSDVLNNKNDFTVSLWGKTPKTSNQGILSGASSGSFNEFIFWFNSSTQFTPHLKNSNDGNLTIDSIADDEWHHLVWTRTGTENCLYFDKTLQGCRTLSSSTLSIESLILGQEQDSLGGGFDINQSWNGLLDELLIFDSSIPVSQIENIYDNHLNGLGYDGSPRTCASVLQLANFRMDESLWDGSPGEIIDQTGNFNAIAVNEATTAGSSPALQGNPGTCRYGIFDGIDDYIQINDDSKLDLKSELSISVWINPKVLPSSGLKTIISKDENYEFHLQPSGEILWWWQTHEFSTVGAAITAGNWHHIAITYKSGRQVIYVDGVNKGSRTFTGNLIVNNDPLQIGQDQGISSRFFDGFIDEVQIFKGELSETEIIDIYNERHPCSDPVIDHYQIIHDGQGITCATETVTIKACTNIADGSNCVESSEPITLELLAAGVTNSVATATSFTGNTTVDFNYTVNENIELSIANETAIPINSTPVCTNNSCVMSFEDAGFIFSGIDDIEVAGVANTDVTIQAVRNDNGVCVGVFDEPKNVDFAIEMASPNSISNKKYTIGSAEIDQNLANNVNDYETVTLNFGADSVASLADNTYFDAGDIVLHAKHTIAATPENPAVTLLGSSAFYVRPYAFEISPTNAANQALIETTASGAITQKAGVEFNLLIEAVNLQGEKTENFTNKSVELSLQRIAPITNGIDGTLTFDGGTIISSASSNDFSDGKQLLFTNGSFQDSQTKYSEVGLLQLAVREQQTANNALNHAQGSQSLGRFTPSYFIQTIISNDEGIISANHSDTCLLESWVYSGQTTTDNIGTTGSIKYAVEPKLTITAYNNDKAITKNYIDDFVKLENDDVSFNAPVSTHINNLPLTGDVSDEGRFDNSVEGVLKYTLSDTHHFTYTRDSNSVVAPFYAAFEVPISSIEDSDGISLKPDDSAGPYFVSPSFTSDVNTGVNVLFGRWNLENSFGPETSDLPQPMYAQYLAANGQYETNIDDSCSIMSSENNEVVLTDGTISASLTSATALTQPLVNGYSHEIGLTAPNVQGDINVQYTVPSWLQFDWLNTDDGFDGPYDQNPTAVATFGVYRGNDRIISWREVGN